MRNILIIFPDFVAIKLNHLIPLYNITNNQGAVQLDQKMVAWNLYCYIIIGKLPYVAPESIYKAVLSLMTG